MEINELLGLKTIGDLEGHQMVLRAIVVFIVALIVIRIAGMRAFGTKSAFDVVVSITMGAILSRCITGHYPFLPCLLAAFTLAVMHRITSFLVYHFRAVQKIAEGDSILLFDHNEELKKNMSKNLISEKDIEKALRQQNVDSVKNVKSIWYETDGKISVVKKEAE
jgi:uncharacterized membrane protein YcaP (DUF421 family)